MKQLFVILPLILLLSSCSSPSSEPAKTSPLTEAPTEEAKILFEYKKADVSQIKLTAAPVETKNGFMRFAGLIAGETKVAVIEIAGKGVLAQNNERIGDYVVKNISEKGAMLCLKSAL